MPPLSQVPYQHRHEIGVAPGGEHGDAVADGPQQKPGNPLLEPEPQRGGDCAVEDGHPARRAAEQDRLDQGAVDRRLEAVRMLRGRIHEMSAPPPKLKKDRKKEEAAKAIDRPKTIWIS